MSGVRAQLDFSLENVVQSRAEAGCVNSTIQERVTLIIERVISQRKAHWNVVQSRNRTIESFPHGDQCIGYRKLYGAVVFSNGTYDW